MCMHMCFSESICELEWKFICIRMGDKKRDREGAKERKRREKKRERDGENEEE